MKHLTLRAIDLAKQRKAQYADVRVVQSSTERVSVKNGVVDGISRDESAGLGVRVLLDGAWAFASSRELNGAEVDRVADMAVQIARASALVNHNKALALGPRVSSQGSYITPIQIDPLSVSIEEKLALLMSADEIMRRVAGVKVRQGTLVALKQHKLFANSEDAFTDQTFYEVGGGVDATADVLVWDLPGNAERIATEALQLLSADPCPRDIHTTVILDGAQIALQVHESRGHPIELDRVYGTEMGREEIHFHSWRTNSIDAHFIQPQVMRTSNQAHHIS